MDAMVSCDQCSGSVSLIAEVCPLCFATLAVRPKASTARSVAEIGAAVALNAAAVMLVTPDAIGNAVVSRFNGAATRLTERSFKKINRELGAIDFFPYEYDSGSGFIAITRNAFVFVGEVLIFAKAGISLARTSLRRVWIDEELSKKKLLRKLKVVVWIEPDPATSKPFQLCYNGEGSRELAEMLVKKLRHYSTT